MSNRGGADDNYGWRYAFLKKRFLRLMVPYFFFGLLYMPCKLALSQFANKPYDINNLWQIFLGVNPDGALWFLYTLFLTQVFLVYFVTKRNMVHVLIWSFLIWLGLAVTKFQFYYVTSALSNFFFVMLGLCMRAVYDNGKCTLLDFPKSSFLDMCGVYTMDIYILHGVVQPVVRAISWHMLHWNYYVCCILMFVFGVIVPLIVSKYIVRRFLWLRRLILGMDW